MPGRFWQTPTPPTCTGATRARTPIAHAHANDIDSDAERLRNVVKDVLTLNADDGLAVGQPGSTTSAHTHPAKYRQALEAGTDPAIVGRWIDEVKLARKAAEIALRPEGTDGRLTSTEIKDLVRQLEGIVAILENADPEDRRAVYSKLNLAVVYHDDGRMQVSAGPDACTNECVGGASCTLTPHTESKWATLPA
ncbi:MAG: hypothetical protein GY708_08025 [Actinomycetia bacterium]|nr:hypothetical protein [Actinomycetes bacterium]MCP4958979.1 hypothetical protein [Actinomycetes bacterium]